ncbi:MAG: hypothetical protein NTU49_04520 [Gammaproteobacteria bacterium]|nr:hypothetical protein [Gammaproteobacteria bacterium]
MNAYWTLLATDPNNNMAVSCSYTNQVGFVIGICIFSFITLISGYVYASIRSNTIAVPDVLRDNWENMQRFFAKPAANFTVTPIKINSNPKDSIAVVTG